MLGLTYSVLVAAIPHSRPFGLSSCIQPQFSASVCPLKPGFQHPDPVCTSWWCLRLGSAGRWHGPSALVSLFCLLQTGFYTLLLSLWSSLSAPAALPVGEGAFQGVGTFPLPQLPLRDIYMVLIPQLFSLLSYPVIWSSVLLSYWVMSNSLWPHGLQHTRLPCPSQTPRASSNLTSIELVMPSNHLILCCPLLLQPLIFPSIRVFSNESVLWIRWPKVLEVQLQHQSIQWAFSTDFL